MFTILKTFFITLLAMTGLITVPEDTGPIDVYHGGAPVLVEDGSIYMVHHATATKEYDNSPRLTCLKPVRFVMGVPVF